TCRNAKCVDGLATVGAICNGSGLCPPLETIQCAPYTCGGSTCATSCKGDVDCGSTARCNIQQGICEPGASCEGSHTLKTLSGDLVECAPYACEGSACTTACTSLRDCAEPNVCGADRKCIPRDQETGVNGDCSCRAGKADSGGLAPWGLAALIACY